MGKVMYNGNSYSGSSDSAESISYDNSVSGLEATNTQGAVDELAEKMSTQGTKLEELMEGGTMEQEYKDKIDAIYQSVVGQPGATGFTIVDNQRADKALNTYTSPVAVATVPSEYNGKQGIVICVTGDDQKGGDAITVENNGITYTNENILADILKGAGLAVYKGILKTGTISVSGGAGAGTGFASCIVLALE